MNKKYLLLAVAALGFIFVSGCGTPANSNQPWDKPIQEDNRAGYKSPDAPPINRDARE